MANDKQRELTSQTRLVKTFRVYETKSNEIKATKCCQLPGKTRVNRRELGLTTKDQLKRKKNLHNDEIFYTLYLIFALCLQSLRSVINRFRPVPNVSDHFQPSRTNGPVQGQK